MSSYVVAIDGPTGTGKSTTAKILAEKLRIKYIDSGAMYRAVTLEILKSDIKPNEVKKIVDFAHNLEFEFTDDCVFANGKEITNDIRSFEVTNKVSSVSKIRQLREVLVNKQREYLKIGSIVMDGRDIGTVVFPNADYKFYLVCDISARAARRQQDFLDMGIKIPMEKIKTEINKRDESDTTRKESPLIKSKDAIEVDTTNMIIEEQVDFLFKKITTSPKFNR
jgi:cytidylate kinase